MFYQGGVSCINHLIAVLSMHLKPNMYLVFECTLSLCFLSFLFVIFFYVLLCYVSGTFHCTFCQTEVEEDESVCPDARTLVARFNEQIEPIYVLLRETEDVNLSHDLLEPEPAEIPALKQRSVSDRTPGNIPFIRHPFSPWY